MTLPDDAPYLSVAALSSLYAAGAATPTEATEALLSRIARIDPELHAYVVVLEERALAQAHRATQEMSRGVHRGPLHGIPIAVKDIFDVEGLPTTAAMPSRLNHRAEGTATIVRRLEDAGAILIGKLTLAEGVFAESVPPFSRPVNPWNADHYPGASSSGNGVAVAAGLAFASVASDTGGSIRLPSASNGVTGLKPTWGRVSRNRTFELGATLDHVGPICRSAADAAAVLQVIAGPDPEDPTSSLESVPDYLAEIGQSVQGLRIGLDRAMALAGVDDTTATALENALTTLASLGAHIVEVHFPNTDQVVEDWYDMCAPQAALWHRENFEANRAQYGPALTAFLDRGNALTATQLQAVVLRRADFRGQMERLFTEVDAVIMPAMAFTAPSMDQMSVITEEIIYGLHRFTCPFTMSQNPTITFPGGFDPGTGLPAAVQLVGPHFREDRLIRLASAFQSRTDWHERHPAL